MGVKTNIQWCDSTVNPTMGCDGCELWTDDVKICYAGTLTERFGKLNPKPLSILPEKKAPFPPYFEKVTEFPGRMLKAANWSDLRGKERPDKPWIGKLPRMIFVSDMGDSLSKAVSFEYLEEEVIQNVISKNGKRHIWQWLTKRPARMAQFAKWLAKRNIPWPNNIWPGTSITQPSSLERIKPLLEVGDVNTIRFLSVEPQWETVNLHSHLKGIKWVIQGGESGFHGHAFNLEWARDVRKACAENEVAYFLKQLGSCV